MEGLTPVDELAVGGEDLEHGPRDRELEALVVTRALAHLRPRQLD